MPWGPEQPSPAGRLERDYTYTGSIRFSDHDAPPGEEVYLSGYVGQVEFRYNGPYDNKPEGYFNEYLEGLVTHLRSMGYRIDLTRTLNVYNEHVRPPNEMSATGPGAPEPLPDSLDK